MTAFEADGGPGGGSTPPGSGGGGGGQYGLSMESKKEIAIDRRKIMRKIREHQRNRGQAVDTTSDNSGSSAMLGSSRSGGSGGSFMSSSGEIMGGNAGEGAGVARSRFGDEKKASSASSLRKIRKEFDDDDIDDDSEEDPTEGFESLQYAISSGSNRQLQPPQQQPLKSNVPPLNPQQSNASILNSQRSWATSTQQQPSLQTSQIHDSQSSQYQTSSPSSTTAKSIRKRKLLHLLYLTICAILLCSFAFLIESTKLMTYARTRATLVSDVLTEMNGVKPQLVEKDGIISDSSSETDTGGETHTSLAKSMPTIIELTPEQEKFNTLQSILSPSISAPESFELTHTPQYRALTFLVSTDGRNLPIPTTSSQEAKFIQRYILTVLYYAMGGEEWNHQFKFLSALDECRWNEKISVEGGQEYIGGVGGCDVNGMIQTVALWDNNLDGQLPMEIGELKSVKVMSLFSNEIHGVLPLNVANMNSLELLYLHSNNLVGDFGFMCPLQIENFRADCFGGTNANVQCSCCNVCCAKNNVHNENACYIQ